MRIRIGVKLPPKVDTWEVSLTCPKCRAQNKVTIAQIKSEETIQCVGCGTEIKVLDKDKSFQQETKKLQQKMQDYSGIISPKGSPILPERTLTLFILRSLRKMLHGSPTKKTST